VHRFAEEVMRPSESSRPHDDRGSHCPRLPYWNAPAVQEIGFGVGACGARRRGACQTMCILSRNAVAMQARDLVASRCLRDDVRLLDKPVLREWRPTTRSAAVVSPSTTTPPTCSMRTDEDLPSPGTYGRQTVMATLRGDEVIVQRPEARPGVLDGTIADVCVRTAPRHRRGAERGAEVRFMCLGREWAARAASPGQEGQRALNRSRSLLRQTCAVKGGTCWRPTSTSDASRPNSPTR